MNGPFPGSCRAGLTLQDFEFVVEALKSRHESVSILDLAQDESFRDKALEDEAVYQRLIDHCSCLTVSPRFYFYVTTRKALSNAHITEREVADYIASILVSFTDLKFLKNRLLKQGFSEEINQPFPYIVDLLKAAAEAPHEKAYFIRIYLGNYTLFLSGLFPERVQVQRERRGSPDLDFYERIGQSSFYHASHDTLAESAHLSHLFEEISSEFHSIRIALNDLAQNVLHLSETLPGYDFFNGSSDIT